MNVTVSRKAAAAALFTSPVQPKDCAGCEALRAAIVASIRRCGVQGCYARLAQECGDHPLEAAKRMRWARAVTDPEGPFGSGPRIIISRSG